MNPYLRNILAVVGGLVVGSIVNMTVLMIMMRIIGLPAGIDPMDADSLNAGMHLFKTRHFITPLLAHAMGTLAGAYVTARFVTKARMFFGFLIGVLFMLGGLNMIFSMPNTPLWFILVDVIVAYLPMAIIGVRLTGKKDE